MDLCFSFEWLPGVLNIDFLFLCLSTYVNVRMSSPYCGGLFCFTLLPHKKLQMATTWCFNMLLFWGEKSGLYEVYRFIFSQNMVEYCKQLAPNALEAMFFSCTFITHDRGYYHRYHSSSSNLYFQFRCLHALTCLNFIIFLLLWGRNLFWTKIDYMNSHVKGQVHNFPNNSQLPLWTLKEVSVQFKLITRKHASSVNDGSQNPQSIFCAKNILQHLFEDNIGLYPPKLVTLSG